MKRITSADSPYSFLQQRLVYVDQHPERSYTGIIENVPEWPMPLPELSDTSLSVKQYAPCHGKGDLIKAVCKQENKKYNLELQPENVLITNGALHGLSLILRSRCRPGAVALCQYPVLLHITQLLSRSGYQVHPFPVQEDGIDFKALGKLCDTSDVRIIFINSPHNPTGGICSEKTLRKLTEFAEKTDAALVSDMVYDDFLFSETKACSPLACHNGLHNILTLGSMSKNFGVPGLRIGWITSDAGNIEKLAGELEWECISVCGAAQEKAYQLICHGNNLLVESVIKRKKSIGKILSGWNNIRCSDPLGGTQFFIELPVDDIENFADYMLIEYGLILATSSNYTGVASSGLRIPIGRPVSLVKHALEMLADGLDRYNNNS